MKVLITASTLPRWDGDAVPAFVLEQAIALRRAYPGLEIEILAPHHAGALRDEVMGGIPVHRFRYFWPAGLQKLAYPAILPNLRRNRWLYLQVPFLLLAECAAILRRCRRRRPDVLYSHWFAPQALAGGVAAQLLRIPHVFTSHSSDVQVMRRLPGLGPALVRRLVGRMSACTVVSRRTLGKLRDFFPGAGAWERVSDKVRVMPMGIDLAGLQPPAPVEREALRADLGLSGRAVILFIGRLTEKKGLFVLLDAFARVAPARRDALLVIAGDGELRESVGRRVRELGLDDCVRMPGYVTGEQKRRWLASADLMVLPSIVTADDDAEGLPVALLEGLAAGKVCVATDVSGADDILTGGVDGFIVPQREPALLADALQRALDLAPAERDGIAGRGRRRAADFDWPVVARAHYEHLLAGIGAATRTDVRERT